jgi:hypothetical protein
LSEITSSDMRMTPASPVKPQRLDCPLFRPDSPA